MRVVGLVLVLFCAFIAWGFVPREPQPKAWLAWLIAAVFAAGAVIGAGLIGSPRRFRRPAHGFLLVWLSIGALLFARRIAFIVENGAMEPPDGMGSPAAFVLGWLTEQLFTSVPAIWSMIRLRRSFDIADADAAERPTL